ncbi:MAG: MoxR family ATPase [Blastocatellia bacterium]|nr:MoxR family ATPase [Blastocatellia bacterium]
MREEVRKIQEMLERQAYITDAAVATSVYLAMRLGKPLLIEGPAGVGKTEIAKVLARALSTNLVRLQCYEGLDAATSLYEWNYAKQLLHIKLQEASAESADEKEAEIFSEPFLLKRPLLEAITAPNRPPVLLIDEVDRSDEEFEAFLLEVLSEFQVTIPELGPIRATHRPYVVLTSNRSRELSDALRRRCLYLWIDYPSFDKELEIIRARVPAISEALSTELTRIIQAVRKLGLVKVPGVAETIDWAEALVALNASELDREVIRETAGCFLKDESDLRRFEAEFDAESFKDRDQDSERMKAEG